MLRLSPALTVSVTERQKRLFMASIQSCEFAIEGALAMPFRGQLTARQPGWLKRQPVIFTAARSGNTAPLARHFNRFPALRQTLSELDYRRFTFQIANGRWRCVIEPWAASEVFCRLPPLRRYLRLERHQRMLLLSVMQMINEALIRFEGEVSPTPSQRNHNFSGLAVSFHIAVRLRHLFKKECFIYHRLQLTRRQP